MSPSSKTSKKPTVALSKVPSVKELCERLGFQHASLKETNSFIDASHAWRKSYKTSDGTLGTNLLSWNQFSVQLELTTMAERFLDDKENGARFWSPTRSWNHNSDVQYPEDRAKIIELLKQLFWKQNRYAANNNHYTKGLDGRDRSRDKTTPIHQTAQTDGKNLPTTSPKSDPKTQQYARRGAAPAPEASHFTSFVDGQAETTPVTQQNAKTDFHVTDNHNECLRQSVEKERDIYEVSDDDSTNVTGKLPKSPARSSKHARTERSAGSRDAPPRKKKRLSVEESPKRRTDRKGVPRSRPGMVPYDVSEDWFEEIKTPSPTQDPSLAPNIDGNGPKDTHSEQSDTYEAPLDPIPNVSYSMHPASKKPYAAPMAPMVVTNKVDDSLLPLVELSPSAEPPDLPSKSQANSPTPTEEDYNEEDYNLAPFQMKYSQLVEVKTLQPRPSEKSVSFPTQAAPTSQTHQETATELLNNLQGVSETDIDSPAEPYTSRTASKSTPDQTLTGHGSSRATSQPGNEAEPADPSVPSTPTEPFSGQRTVKASTAEIEQKENPQDRPQFLKIHQGGRSSSAENGPLKPRPKTQIPLWIITREPRYTEERWDDGKFQGTQLSDFLEGVSKVTQRDHIEKVKLTLRTPTFDTKITVFKDADDSWISAKERFLEKLKEARAEARAKRPNEPANFEILVEPFYEQNAELSSKFDEDEEEFEF